MFSNFSNVDNHNSNNNDGDDDDENELEPMCGFLVVLFVCFLGYAFDSRSF